MPPRGGNPTLDDEKLLDVIAFLRVLQASVASPESAGAPEVALGPPVDPGAESTVHRSVIPHAADPPAGLAHAPETPEEPQTPGTPEGAHRFFAIYFMMTGLHGLHVIGGMAFIAYLLVGALLGRYHATYFTPVDLGGLFWHLVDLIWIFLFPLFYLI
ncbi:MAG: cytochrome c oxidase subunit 3 [Gemmatimonadetes bacterium]|nr:cytochrome c oxidase subunit 3 [Gemmatimonadota bacterium]